MAASAICAMLTASIVTAENNLPSWYLELMQNRPEAEVTLDSDGDGIPDLWERRVFSDPNVADSHLDRDGDGLTDLEEFHYGSDPRVASTMGDRWLDSEKLAVGYDAVFCVTPATGWQQWLQWLDWSEQQWWERTATNSAGFTHHYAGLITNKWPYSDITEAADFLLRTRTDRSALLTIADAASTNTLPIPPGKHTFRLRAAFNDLLNLSLDPAPGSMAEIPGALDGLWICQMRVEPLNSSTAIIDIDNIPEPETVPDNAAILLILTNDTSNSIIHQLSAAQEENSDAQQVLNGCEVTHSFAGTLPIGGPGKPTITIAPLQAGSGAYDLGLRCPCVGCTSWPRYSEYKYCDTLSKIVPGGTSVIAVDYMMDLQEAQAMLQADPQAVFPVTRRISSKLNPFIYQEVKFSFTTCQVYLSVPQLIGSEFSNNPNGHTPGMYGQRTCECVNCNCSEPEYAVVGYDHDKVNTRNILPELKAGTDDSTDHCLGLIWRKGGETNLFTLLHESCLAYTNLLSFSSSNAKLSITPEGVMLFGASNPENLEPTISLIKLHYKPNPNINIVFDRLWVVVNRSDAQTRFNTWYTANSDISWTTNLPKPFARITLSTNTTTGAVTPVAPESGEPNIWNVPQAINTFLHHDAAYEMRSHPITGGHGHQAMYSIGGKLIVTPIAAGSADLFAPYDADGTPQVNTNHRNHDVYPFIRALQLDGNPIQKVGKIGWIDAPRNIDRPAIFKGSNINKYIERRPVLP